MEALVKEGHTVYAICPRGDKFDLFQKYGVETVAYKIERSSLNPFKEIKAIHNIYTAIKPLDLDILHTFTAKPNIYGTFAGKLAKVPVIINLVEGLGSFYIEDTLKDRSIRTLIEVLYKMVFSLSQQTVFVNSDDPKYFEEKGVIASSKITIIKSVGIDTKIFDPEKIKPNEIRRLKKELQVEDSLVILMVARAIWHKGIREYYEAAVLLSDHENVQFILVGDIDKGNPSAADEVFLNSANVLWLGQRNDVLELTALSDIYVLPSYREGVPRTLLEAAAMGKAIVTTDTVGCREVVKDEVNGFLVPTKNADILAEKIKYLIDHPDERKVMGKNGRIRAINEFDVKRVISQYMELYEKFKMEMCNAVAE
jgi:N,N'-diacetylbacillosaminyl-diphospho-undecaprenol alpha-1,3-N-acetylgalactosaminyltransferase